jgi:pyruvate/2-oxoacid:ferredoxin oxidoreductase alpha subunit
VLFVVEMNMGQMVREIERVVRDTPIVGIHRASGQPIDPDEIVSTAHHWLEHGDTLQPHTEVFQMSV